MPFTFIVFLVGWRPERCALLTIGNGSIKSNDLLFLNIFLDMGIKLRNSEPAVLLLNKKLDITFVVFIIDRSYFSVKLQIFYRFMGTIWSWCCGSNPSTEEVSVPVIAQLSYLFCWISRGIQKNSGYLGKLRRRTTLPVMSCPCRFC